MAMDQRRFWCRTCKQYRLFARDKRSPGAGLGCLAILLVPFTLGLSLLLLLAAGPLNLLAHPYKCQTCGENKRRA